MPWHSAIEGKGAPFLYRELLGDCLPGADGYIYPQFINGEGVRCVLAGYGELNCLPFSHGDC